MKTAAAIFLSLALPLCAATFNVRDFGERWRLVVAGQAGILAGLLNIRSLDEFAEMFGPN